MISIKTRTNETLVAFFKNLEKVADLDYYEGPLVSLFFDPLSYRLYIYEWCDHDSSHNRWLIYETNFTALQSLMNNEIGHRDLLLSAEKDVYYLVDIRFDQSILYYDNISLITKAELPEAYLPHPDARYSFFQTIHKNQLVQFLASYESNLKQAIQARLKSNDLPHAQALLRTLQDLDIAQYGRYQGATILLMFELAIAYYQHDLKGEYKQIIQELQAIQQVKSNAPTTEDLFEVLLALGN